MSVYKITNKHLDDKFLKHLAYQGSVPAFSFFIDRLNKEPHRRKDIPKFKSYAKKRHPDMRINFNAIEAIAHKKNLISIDKELQNFPMKALINPWNNEKLNIKLSSFNSSKRIKKYSFSIGANNLSHRGEKFTSADMNNIRQSIIWLNWFHLNSPKISRPGQNQLCLNSHALSIVLAGDLNELLKYAKYDKKVLKKYFSIFSDNKKCYLSFLSSASLELGELFAHRIRLNQIENLVRCYECFIDAGNDLRETNQYPNYFMFNPLIIKNQKNLKLLFELGYNRMINMKFLQRENLILLDKQDLYVALHRNFSKLKN